MKWTEVDVKTLVMHKCCIACTGMQEASFGGIGYRLDWLEKIREMQL